MNIFMYLKYSREILKLSKEEISNILGVNIKEVNNIESNKIPDIENWSKIIKTYKLNEDIFYEKIFEQSKIENFPYFLFEPYRCNILKKIELTEEETELLGLICFYGFENIPYEYVSKKGSFKILNIKNNIESKLGKYEDRIIKYLKENPNNSFSIKNLSFKEIFNLFKDDCYIKDYLRLFEIIDETKDKKIEIFNNRDYDDDDYDDYNEKIYDNEDVLMLSLLRVFKDLNSFSETYVDIKKYLEKDIYKNFFIYEKIEDTSTDYLLKKNIDKDIPWQGSIYIKLNTYSSKILEWYQSSFYEVKD